MKGIFLMVLAVIGICAFILTLLYVLRAFNNVATPITVHTVKEGVECATMVTADGAAIDCWKI